MDANTLQICFVCLGNICRSPTGEGVMLHLLQQRGLSHLIGVDSAGTAAYHLGKPADSRAARAAARRGVDLPSRGRQFLESDFQRFAYVLAMDNSNLSDLHSLSRGRHDEKIYLLRDFDPNSPPGSSVPDPYYGGEPGFEHVLDLCFSACEGLLEHLVSTHGLHPEE
jgi:protein-tyrosine phosphatase